jgi:hypothetical protein
MKLNEIKVISGVLVDAWGSLQEIEALQLGLRYCEDIFGEANMSRVVCKYAVSEMLSFRVRGAHAELKAREEAVALLEGRQTRSASASSLASEELLAARAAVTVASSAWEDLYHTLGKEEDRIHRISFEFFKEVDAVIEACNTAFPAPVLAIITAGARTVGRVQDAFGMCVTPAGALAALRAWLDAQPRLSVAAVDELWRVAFEALSATLQPGTATVPWKAFMAAARGIVSATRGKSAIICSADRAMCLLIDTVRAAEARHLGLGTRLSDALEGHLSVGAKWEGFLSTLSSDAVTVVLLAIDSMALLVRGRAAAATVDVSSLEERQKSLREDHKCFDFHLRGKCRKGDSCQYKHA